MSVVSIDVEPGGPSSPLCSIGIAELDAGEVGSVLGFRIKSPLCSWTPPHLQDLPTFADVLPFVDSLIAGRLVSAYSWGYDRAALLNLCAAAQLQPPAWEMICGRQAAIAAQLPTRRGFRDLQSMTLSLGLLEEAAIERRREIHRQASQSKWLLHDAVDDAWANAMVLQRAATALGTEPELLPVPHHFVAG